MQTTNGTRLGFDAALALQQGHYQKAADLLRAAGDRNHAAGHKRAAVALWQAANNAEKKAVRS